MSRSIARTRVEQNAHHFGEGYIELRGDGGKMVGLVGGRRVAVDRSSMLVDTNPVVLEIRRPQISHRSTCEEARRAGLGREGQGRDGGRTVRARCDRRWERASAKRLQSAHWHREGRQA